MPEEKKRNFTYGLKFACPVAILLVLLTVFCVALFGPLETNEYENRYAEKIARPSLKTYISSEFQDSVETGLADQLPFGIEAKKLYNTVFSAFNSAVYNYARSFYASTTIPEELYTEEELAIAEAEKEAARIAEIKKQQALEARGIRKDVEIDPNFTLITLSSGTQIYGDHLFNSFTTLSSDKENISSRVADTNEFISNHPDLEINIYYIEAETDVNFETGERSGIYEYLAKNINLPEENKACFMLNSFAEFDTYFYKYDHHWNYRGSYKAYKNILKWLLPEESPLTPVEKWEIGPYRGSKATGTNSNYSETLIGYEFDFNENITVSINGSPASSYSYQRNYINNAKNGYNKQGVSYGTFYGQDNGEVIFTNPDSSNGNILIIGESYDNALLDLLSQHFSTLYSIDLRNYKAQIGKTFDIEDYLQAHEIDRVLLIGSKSFWDKEVFSLYK